MSSPSKSHCELIQRTVNRLLPDSRSSLEAFDAAKRELRSAIDLDWDLVHFDTSTSTVSPIDEQPEAHWSTGTLFMLPGEMP